ncbi:MAG TPA: transketolase [Lachnospiraceae bacterium]|nr:transketolase [Lachnospiraceae bacterium]
MNTGSDDLNVSIYNVKKRMLWMANKCGSNTHIGGAFSMADILTVLYKSVLNYDFSNTEWEGRDRFILSKGHCVVALYAVLAECGILSEEELMTFQKNGSELCAHPVMNLPKGIESSNGSLGQGISMAAGIAKSAKLLAKEYKVYTLIGNGESNEGSVWETAMLAAHWGLDNFTVILDNNSMQSDGDSKDILDMEDIAEKWRCFGFTVYQIDGHNIAEILKAFESPFHGKPKIIIADTIKGHGISFMENNNAWHHNRLTGRYYELACQELEGQRDGDFQ